MTTAKQLVTQLLDRLPDDVTMEDIHYHLYVLQKVEAGRRDLDEGRYTDEGDMDKRVDAWLAESGGREKQAMI